MTIHDLVRALDELTETGRLRKETGHDTANVRVSFPVNFLYDD
jgi:hypothetical protein